MKRKNFLATLFGLPFAVKAIAEKSGDEKAAEFRDSEGLITDMDVDISDIEIESSPILTHTSQTCNSARFYASAIGWRGTDGKTHWDNGQVTD